MKRKKETINKKPFYKRWWFILLAVLAVIIIATKPNQDSNESANTNVNEETEEKSENLYEYNIIDEEFSQIGAINRIAMKVTTPEELNKEQIEELLKQLAQIAEKENKNYDKKKDDLYIFLYENELIANDGYSLGRFIQKDNKTEIDAKQKDWSKKPSEKDYELYSKFMEKFGEMDQEAFEKDELSVADEEEVMEEVAKEEDTDTETITNSINKVNFFMIMDEE